MPLGNSQRNARLDATLAAWTASSPDLYVALWEGSPGSDLSGGAELSGGGYARVLHNAWNAAAAGIATNDGIITFGSPTVSWGTATHVVLLDSLTLTAEANLMAFDELDVARLIVAGFPPRFADQALGIRVT